MMTLKVNGRDHQIDAEPDTPLLYVLRDDLKLNAAKFGCGLGQCGSCTVIVDGKAVLSCVTPLVLLEGKQVTTLEGLGSIATPAPIQRAFIEEQAAQCGYCIAGMMMRAQALLQRVRQPTDEQIRAELAPHLCRCGTHMRIIRAVKRAARLMDTAALAPTQKGAHDERSGHSRSPQGACRRWRVDRQLLADRGIRTGSGHAGSPAAEPPGSLETSPYLDAWIRIDADNTITVFTGKAELGKASRPRFSRSRPKSSTFAFNSLKVVTADTKLTPMRDIAPAATRPRTAALRSRTRRRRCGRCWSRRRPGGSMSPQTACGPKTAA